MCGIAGIVDLNANREIDRTALEKMSNALVHRGPDGEGVFIEPGIGLTHRRLAIIDIEGGVQPFHAQDGSGVLSFNGEIYNYRTLAAQLTKDGVQIRTRSDTEALTEGFARHGKNFVHSLRGMFAISYWDKKTKTLTLARDRLGERPLYYSITNSGFLVFASEIRALVASGLTETRFNHQAIADYFHYGFVPDPKTIYEGVLKLPPGHILNATPGKDIQIERYWRPVFAASRDISFDDAAQILASKIDDAVAAQMISDAPLGAFLSGGVDSSGIVAAMHSSGGELITCTVGFEEASHDERSFAREIANKYGSSHHEHVAKFDALVLIDEIAGAFGEPFADSSAFPTYIVSRLARENVKVALSGDGGDEIFAGYRRYRFYLAEEKLRGTAPLFLRKALFGPAGALYPKLDNAPQFLRAKTTLQALSRSRAEGYASALAINLPHEIKKVFSRDFRSSIANYNPSNVVSDAMADANTDDPLACAQYADLMTWLPGRMLTKVDRASMAHSLEVRPPLLDHELVQWAGLLPSHYKLANGVGKRILKAALEPRLTHEFMARPKQGFDMPIADWLRQKRANPVNRMMRLPAWRETGIFDETAVQKMIDAHQSGARNFAQELWSLVMFDAFLRQNN